MDKHDLNPHKPNAVHVEYQIIGFTKPKTLLRKARFISMAICEIIAEWGDTTGKSLRVRKSITINLPSADRKITGKEFRQAYKLLKDWAIERDCRRNDNQIETLKSENSDLKTALWIASGSKFSERNANYPKFIKQGKEINDKIRKGN